MRSPCHSRSTLTSTAIPRTATRRSSRMTARRCGWNGGRRRVAALAPPIRRQTTSPTQERMNPQKRLLGPVWDGSSFCLCRILFKALAVLRHVMQIASRLRGILHPRGILQLLNIRRVRNGPHPVRPTSLLLPANLITDIVGQTSRFLERSAVYATGRCLALVLGRTTSRCESRRIHRRVASAS